MNGPNPIYELLEARLKTWAEAQPELRAVLVIGSRARSSHPADAFSDLDTIIIVDAPRVWALDPAWLHKLKAALGLPVWFIAFDTVIGDDPEWECVFDDGSKLDMTFTANRAGPEAGLAEVVAATPYGFVFERGCRVLVNKQPGPLLDLKPNLPDQTLPTPAEFEDRVANALLELVRAGRMYQRGEYWRAAHAINHDFQSNAVALLEWQARSANPPRTAWHYGRFLEQWADEGVLKLLPAAHAAASRESVRLGLLGGAALLARLVPQTAAQLGFACPSSFSKLNVWLGSILS